MYLKTSQMTSKASKTICPHLSCAGLLIVFALMVGASAIRAEETSENPTSIDSQTELTSEDDGNQASPTRPKTPELITRERAMHTELAAESEKDEIVWLDIKYPGAASSFQSLALAIPPKTPQTQGATLIIPDTQQNADWPVLVKQLRHELPYKGWHTLSLNLPWPELSDIPKREKATKTFDHYNQSPAITKASLIGSRGNSTDTSEPSESGESEAELDAESSDSVDINLTASEADAYSQPPYIPRALVHVHAGMNFLKQQGYQNIALIAIGKSAELAVEYLQSREDEVAEKGFALILIKAQLYNDTNKNFSKEIGGGFPAPIVDFVENKTKQEADKAKERKYAARAGGFANYQQIDLASARTQTSYNFLLKRTSDWLNTHSPGQRQAN